MKVCQVLCKTGWYSASWTRIEKVRKDNMLPVLCKDTDTDAAGPYCRIRYVKVK